MFAFETVGALATTDSPSPVSEESFPTDDGFNQFEEMDGGDDVSDAVPKRKSRRPPSTAERRATHNAVERARRESLNGRFMDLATALPTMANVKRPSKSVIVAKSLEFVQHATAREQALINQNDALRQELNELRARLGMTPVPSSPTPTPLTSRPRQHSIVSSDGANSPIGTPANAKGSFDAAPPSSAMLQFGPPAFGSPFSEKMSSKSMSGNPTLAPSPPVTSAYGHPGAPVVDMNYFMAMSIQHQHQQSLAMMHHRGGNFPPPATAAPWGLGMGVMAGGPDANWLFT